MDGNGNYTNDQSEATYAALAKSKGAYAAAANTLRVPTEPTITAAVDELQIELDRLFGHIQTLREGLRPVLHCRTEDRLSTEEAQADATSSFNSDVQDSIRAQTYSVRRMSELVCNLAAAVDL